jgi:Asp/Glu/hydantoin racemase
MHILLINANTTEAITERVVAEARRIVAPGSTVSGATARFGARYVATRTAYAIAGHAALDAYAEFGAGADAVVLACFGDPGLAALRELAGVPVAGMAEAACQLAARQGRRFSIVTGGARWVEMLQEFVAGIGLGDRLASVRAVAPTGAQIAADPAGSRAMLARACTAAAREDGADVVILGGAGLVGIAEQIAGEVPVPLIDGLAAAVRRAEALAAERVGSGSGRRASRDGPIETIGLGARLTALLSAGR